MQEILVVVFRMVEVSDDQLPILGPEQFDFREHGLNGWLYWTATASLAVGVEINGIELFA